MSSSWGEALRLLEQSKRAPPVLRPVQSAPSHYRTAKKARDRFDIILQQYRDSDIEHIARSREHRSMVDAINKGKDGAIVREGTVDNINHRSKYVGGSELVPPDFVKPHRRAIVPNQPGGGYNIIDNTYPNGQEPLVEKLFNRKISQASRDFNIISNDYINNNEKKKKVDTEFERRSAMQKYWKQNKFDVVRCAFNHPTLEERFVRERDEDALKHGVGAVQHMPSCVRDSEGSLYDIVSTLPIDAERLELKEQQSRARTCGRKLKHSFETRNLLEMLKTQRRDAERARRRVSHMRYQTVVDRGYHVINNAPLKGIGADVPAPARTLPRNPLAAVLNRPEPQKIVARRSLRKSSPRPPNSSAAGTSPQYRANPIRVRCSGFQKE